MIHTILRGSVGGSDALRQLRDPDYHLRNDAWSTRFSNDGNVFLIIPHGVHACLLVADSNLQEQDHKSGVVGFE